MAEDSAVKYSSVRKALEREPAPPAMVEHTFEPALCEQLIWRRGDHLWKNEEARLFTLLEGSRRCRFGAGTLAVSSPDLIDRARKEADGMGLICGPAKALSEPAEDYLSLVKEIAVRADDVFLQGELSSDPGLCREELQVLQQACDAVHRVGKSVIWVDRSQSPLPPDKIAELPFDGLQLTDRYRFSTEDAIRMYQDQFCLLGRTDFLHLQEMSPMELIRDHARLWELCDGRGYIFGTGDIDGRPLPYLTFISMITAVNRLK